MGVAARTRGMPTIIPAAHAVAAGLTDYAPGQVPPATDPLPEDASEAADRAQRGLLEEDGNA